MMNVAESTITETPRRGALRSIDINVTTTENPRQDTVHTKTPGPCSSAGSKTPTPNRKIPTITPKSSLVHPYQSNSKPHACNWQCTISLADSNMKVKQADFGMAITLDQKEVVAGSPVHMSPEHLMARRHDAENFDHQSDICILGVLLCEMLLGCLPCEIVELDGVFCSTPSGLVTTNNTTQRMLEEGLSGLALADDKDEDEARDEDEEESDDEFADHPFPVPDLRKLNDQLTDEPFCIPPPICPPGSNASCFLSVCCCSCTTLCS